MLYHIQDESQIMAQIIRPCLQTLAYSGISSQLEKSFDTIKCEKPITPKPSDNNNVGIVSHDETAVLAAKVILIGR